MKKDGKNFKYYYLLLFEFFTPALTDGSFIGI